MPLLARTATTLAGLSQAFERRCNYASDWDLARSTRLSQRPFYKFLHENIDFKHHVYMFKSSKPVGYPLMDTGSEKCPDSCEVYPEA